MRRFLLASGVLVSAFVFPALAQQSVPAAQTARLSANSSSLSSALPVVAEHRYRMTAKIRPLLLFWVGRDNVGGARIQWRQGADGTRGWELLIGSDPRRAPTHVNRWGYVREEANATGATMIGVMKQSDEQSLDEAKAHVQNEGGSGYVYKLIRTSVAAGELTALVSTSVFTRDFTYRDLPTLMQGFETQPVKAGMPKQVRLGQGTKPGFLVAIAGLIHDTVWTFHRSGASALTARAVTYAYNGQLYDLSLARPHLLKNAKYGSRTYPTLLDADFEVRNRVTGGKESFSVVYGTDGDVEEVPVWIAYQPRWWFKAELVLDENEKF